MKTQRDYPTTEKLGKEKLEATLHQLPLSPKTGISDSRAII